MRLVVDALALSRGQRLLIEGLDVSVAAGEALIVTGPNGAGKSTFLRALAGLLVPAAGRIWLEGAPDPDDAVPVHAHYIGHQEASRGMLTAAENLAFWAAVLGTGEGGADARAALETFGLPQVADLPVAYLSAGQRRRVALARLLVAPRPIWLLDEPTTALDAASRAAFAGLMRQHLAAGGLIIAATHSGLGLDAPRELRLGEAE
ncbi:MAG: heme ABC exporter ATP-binding protein CcmA [Rhodospirillales bacterium 20-64-7]|nr:MAG: heme ABC exporter ATP-binding protein CcmA [Rhodospirillales bacterium 20-64-7]